MRKERRLLILDDDPAVGQTVQFIAAAAGFEARHCCNPQAFFALVASWQPTHIALDLVMPTMDGVEVMSQLAVRGTQARLILVSGMAGRVLEAAGRSAAEHGLDVAGVLPKPFAPARLRALLDGACASGAGAPFASLAQLRPAEPAAGPTVTDLVEAIEQRQFSVAYQPKLSCRDGQLAGFEALARWQHPRLGMVPPERFIAVAERHGLIDAITLQVFEQALQWFDGLDRDDAAALRLSVNLSARSLDDHSLVDALVERCLAKRIDPPRIVFELTETSAMACPVAALDLMTRLRMKGFQLSLDDFGTGYSSMVQLVRLPFTEIKVDRSFVMAVERSAEARSVVRSIVDLGHSLGLETTAEGVEDAATLKFLDGIGCDLAQGYYFSRPLPGAEAACWWPARPDAADTAAAGAR